MFSLKIAAAEFPGAIWLAGTPRAGVSRRIRATQGFGSPAHRALFLGQAPRKVIRWHRPIEVPGAINHQGLPMLLKHLLLQNGDGGGLTATVVSWSGITPKDANSRIGRQPRIDVADGCEKLRVNW